MSSRAPRDAQRRRIYLAETPLPGRRFRTLPECAAYADSVVGTLWWQARFPNHTLANVPRLRPGYGARQAFYREDDDGPTITLPRRYRTSGVILHELAHWALCHEHDLPNHGRTFARLLLDVTYEFMGNARGDKLAEAYGEQKVHLGKPATLGPDGKLRYGTDERLRLSKGKRVTVFFENDEREPAATTATFKGFAPGGASLLFYKAPAIPKRAVWAVVRP